MATTSPTPNYGWVLPVPGSSIGAWGTILNKVFGEDGTPLGIDGVLKGIADDVDTAETDLASLDTRVDTLEAAGTSAYYARIYRSGNQTVPSSTPTQVTFNAESIDEGGLASGASVTLPAGAGGVYEIRAQIEGDFHSSGDNARSWVLEIRKDGATVATAKTPALNDGAFGSGGEITLRASYFDASAEAGTVYTVYVTSSSGSAQLTGTTSATFLEAVRLIAA